MSDSIFSIALPLARSPRPFRVIPGFGITLGFTLLYLSLLVLIPLSAVFLKTFTLTWEGFWQAVTSPRVIASYRLSFGVSFLAAAVRSEEHTSELQSLMRISYAVFCLKKKKIQHYLNK